MWLDEIKNRLKKYDKQIDDNDAFVKSLSTYLKEKTNLNYSDDVLNRTIQDVLALDEDLLNFVKTYINEDRLEMDGLSCDYYFTMENFLAMKKYNPVTAAIFFQMYRENPKDALRTLIMTDKVM